MDSNNRNIPSEMAMLMVGYFHHTLTPQEHDKLNEWLETSDENIEVFEKCLEMTHRPRQPETDPDMDEEERELRYIIELIVKYVQQTITKEERKTLDQWASASLKNKKLLEEMPLTNDMEKVYHWLVERFNKEQDKVRLN